MNVLNALFSALGGACALAALVAAVTSYFKARAAAARDRQQVCNEYKHLSSKLDVVLVLTDMLASGLATAQEENAAKDRRIAKLERDLSRALELTRGAK